MCGWTTWPTPIKKSSGTSGILCFSTRPSCHPVGYDPTGTEIDQRRRRNVLPDLTMALKNPFRRTDKETPNMQNETVKNESVTSEHTDQGAMDTHEPATADMPSEPVRTEAETLNAEVELLRAELQAVTEKHLRLFAEFDNFRKRTAKERLELMQYAGENALKAVVPVLDDLSRAVANNEAVDDVAAVREGVTLIYQKLQHVLAGQGLKAMPDAKGEPFDTDRHEAITKAPAPTPNLKGKVLEVIENGYTLHDKVIHYAKVVVGE